MELELAGAGPYDGLYEISRECWRVFADSVYMTSQAVPRQRIIGNAPSVFDDIRWFLENLIATLSWTRIAEGFRNILLSTAIPYINDRMIKPLKDLANDIRWHVVNSFGGWIGALHDRIVDLQGVIRDPLNSLREYLHNRLVGIQAVLSGGMNALREYVSDHLNSIAEALRGELSAFRTYVHDRIASLENSLRSTLNSVRDYLVTTISNLSLILRDPLAGLREAIEWFKTTWLGNLIQVAWSAISNLWNTVVAGVSAALVVMIPKVVTLARQAADIAGPFVRSLWAGLESIPSTYLNWLATTAGTDLALTPSRALTTIATLYGMSIIAGSTAMVTSTVLDMIPTVNWVGAAQFSGFVAQAAAFDPLTRAAYGTLINDALAQPLKYHWNQRLRPYMPTIGEVYTMGRKHGLTMGEFRTAMSYQGLPDWWIDKIYDFFWTDPSPMWLLRMTEGGVPTISSPGRKREWLDAWLPNWSSDPMAWLKMKLMLAGYEDIDIQPMIDGMTMRRVQPSITTMKTRVRAMVRDAYWTETDASNALTPLGVRPDEIHTLVLAEELDYQHSFLDDQVSYFVEQFRKDVLTEQDLNLALSTVFTKRERVAQVIARERVRKLPTPKAVTPAKEDPNVTRLRTQAVDSWIKLYRDWRISEEDLLLALTLVVGDPDLAAKMVVTEKTRFRPEPTVPKPAPEDPIVAASRRQAIATWVTAFRNGEINADELELYLQPLMPDDTTRRQVVQLEQLRYQPTPELIPLVTEDAEIAKVRAEYVRGHITMFERRQIGVEELYQYLMADGLSEPLSRATTITQATKRMKVPAITSPYYLQDRLAEFVEAGLDQYESAYMQGLITIDEYTAWLGTLTKDQDVVTYLADQLVLRRFTESF